MIFQKLVYQLIFVLWKLDDEESGDADSSNDDGSDDDLLM